MPPHHRNPLVAAAPRPASATPDAWVAALRDAGFAALAVDSDAPPPRGARIAFVRHTIDIADEAVPASAERALALAAGHRAALELTLASRSAHDRPSAPRGVPRGAALVSQLARQAQAVGVSITLRPRRDTWMQRIDDAARVAMRVNRVNVGLTLSLPDWLAADGGTIETRLKLALPRMMNVIVGEASDEGAILADAGRRMLRAGYGGPVTVEVASEERDGVEQVIARMRGVVGALR